MAPNLNGSNPKCWTLSGYTYLDPRADVTSKLKLNPTKPKAGNFFFQ